MRGEVFRFCDDFFDGAMKSRTGQRRRARAARSLAKEDFVGGALNVLRVIGMNAERVADELLEHGLVPLSLRDASGKQGERTRPIEPHFGSFEAKGTRTFDRIGNA